MKHEHWLIVVALMLLAALAGAMKLNMRAEARQARVVELEMEIARRKRAEREALRLSPPMAEYAISSPAGVRLRPMGGDEEGLHKGADLVGPKSCTILAAAPGIVVEHWPAPGTPRSKGGTFGGHPVFGGFVILDHGSGIYTLYGHMSRTVVHTGQRVGRGEILGYQGATGDATGEHLHFEVVRDPMVGLVTEKAKR
jgi:murein DD-endopeptidase MepM/ murein hydrolase activator NlpD